ncbi:Cytochrome b5 heme-binding domain-containing protein [Fusarium sp. Ph1]|nr:Cytochrome b5 heme-binding domain-containing protein [Fusarium sp. Ph1]
MDDRNAQDGSIHRPNEQESVTTTNVHEVVVDPEANPTKQLESPGPEKLHLSFASQLRKLVKEHSETMGDSDDLRRIQDVASEILYSRPSTIRILSYIEISMINLFYLWIAIDLLLCFGPILLHFLFALRSPMVDFRYSLLMIHKLLFFIALAFRAGLQMHWRLSFFAASVAYMFASFFDFRPFSTFETYLKMFLVPLVFVGLFLISDERNISAANIEQHFLSLIGRIKDWWRGSMPREFPLEPVQLTWECICSNTRIAVVPRSFAQRLVEIRKQTLPVSPISVPNTPTIWGFPSTPTSSSSHQSNPWARDTHNWQPLSRKIQGQAKQPQAAATSLPTAIPMTVKCRYVLFIVDTDRLYLRTIESQSLSNEQLFDRMRLEYRLLKGWFRTWFGLWIFSHCDFYKFEAWTRERYCERGRGIPPASEAGYFYMPRPMDNEPPISKHEFYDRFYKRITPEQLRAVHGSFYNDHDAVDRIPQKKGLNEITVNGRSQFWGIIAREKKSGKRMLIYIFLSSLPGFVFFFLWLFVLDKGSLQDASTLLMVSFTLLGILYAAQLL